MEYHYHIRLYNPLASHHASDYIEWKTSLASLKAIRHGDVALDKMGYNGFLWSFLRSGKVQCNSDVCQLYRSCTASGNVFISTCLSESAEDESLPVLIMLRKKAPFLILKVIFKFYEKMK